MIVDADAHVTLTEAGGNNVGNLLHQMDRAGIDRAMIWLQPPYMRDIGQANRYVYECARQYSDRLIPFGWSDPHFGVTKAVEEIRRCHEDYGMVGIKLNGAQNTFYIDDLETVDPLIAEIAERDIVLALHIGADFYEFTHPYRAAKIARRYPKLRMLLAHMGGAGKPDLSNACIEFACENPNMYLIGSAVSYLQVLKAVKLLGASRVLFGSDTPFALPRVEVAAYNALLEGEVTANEKENIMGLNLLRILKIH